MARVWKYGLIGIVGLVVWGGLFLMPSDAQDPGEFKALMTLLEETKGIRVILENNLQAIQKDLKNSLQPRWEYLVVSIKSGKDTDNLENLLKSLGNDGWELVALDEDSGYIFKRRDISESAGKGR